jgi:hypothetical protein
MYQFNRTTNRRKSMMIPDLIEAIQQETEWLSTTDGDEIECISIENLEVILSRIFNQKINIKQDEL